MLRASILERFNIDVPLADFFSFPTVAALASYIALDASKELLLQNSTVLVNVAGAFL